MEEGSVMMVGLTRALVSALEILNQQSSGEQRLLHLLMITHLKMSQRRFFCIKLYRFCQTKYLERI